MRIVLLSKRDSFSREAQDIARECFGSSLVIAEGAVGDPRPECLSQPGDYLISFLSPWIVTEEELARYDTAINFHPGTVDYPGIGCYNFALYDEAIEFGATCHHMLPKVDTGAVVLERRFAMRANHSVETLKLDTMNLMLGMFRDIAAVVGAGRELPRSPLHWTRKPFTHRDMEALKIIRLPADIGEVRRRIRATVYPGYPGPVLVHPSGRQTAVPMPKRAAYA